ncbi:Galectin-related protein [Varanus komodoensis]|nr:Galectin-related protein [Varanus komodoensis]
MSAAGHIKMTENDKCTNVERYTGEIKGGLRPTMKITIMGVIYPNPKSFSVTLLCDPVDNNTSKDVGLLLVVNFTEKSIIRDSRIAGKWGKEEKTIPYFPFTAEESFKMELFCEHQQIRILLDGRQLCSFSHRVQPIQRVTALQISGDVKLTKVV